MYNKSNDYDPWNQLLIVSTNILPVKDSTAWNETLKNFILLYEWCRYEEKKYRQNE